MEGLKISEPDELCGTCSKIDLFSLFTGPRYFPGDGHEQRVRVELGTLKEVKSNTRCPLCRLVRHDLYGTGQAHPWEFHGNEVDPSKVRCSISPFRADYGDEMKYLNPKTKDMVATKLRVRLSELENCSKEELDLIQHHYRGPGIQLLSPDSVDPARPLHNGFHATTTERSLALLSKWITECYEFHQDNCSSGELWNNIPYSGVEKIRVIDIRERKLTEHNLADISYAALSYVWGQDQAAYTNLQQEIVVKNQSTDDEFIPLPLVLPKVIEDALHVCKTLSIPYLWVDLYCIDQVDLTRKSSEINAMGHIYHHSNITLIAGCRASLDGNERSENQVSCLIPASNDRGAMQRIEIIHGRKYISALPSIQNQIRLSEWHIRGWTMQEGELARRVAFFGEHDISFMCGAGHWREATHSGIYGHEANISGIDMHSEGYYVLSGLTWLSTTQWKFKEYLNILMAYTGRELSFDSDILNAISGCLNIIAQKKKMRFFSGLPSIDFHFALLWTGEYDRPREGFPSWSWAGWHALQQYHLIYPHKSGSESLVDSEDGSAVQKAPAPQDIELEGLLISLTERPHRFNRCLQQWAYIRVPELSTVITVTSEVAHFFVDIVADPTNPQELVRKGASKNIPSEFDSTVDSTATWDTSSEYSTPYARLRLRDSSNNIYTHYYPYWYDHWPPLKLEFPRTLRGSTLNWLLHDGIDLIKIVEVELLEGAEGLKPFHHVLCLGIDRSEGLPNRARRMGAFCIPKDIWDKGRPTEMTVEFW